MKWENYEDSKKICDNDFYGCLLDKNIKKYIKNEKNIDNIKNIDLIINRDAYKFILEFLIYRFNYFYGKFLEVDFIYFILKLKIN